MEAIFGYKKKLDIFQLHLFSIYQRKKALSTPKDPAAPSS